MTIFSVIWKRKPALVLTTLLLLWALAPEWPAIPVQGATHHSWNPRSFWYEPWGVSGVHKGIDIFANSNTPVLTPTYGLVVFRGELPLGGKVVALLGPKWRLHYFAHLHEQAVYPGMPVARGRLLGTVGTSGNAQGKPPHLHYSVITLLPYPWRADRSTQGWKKMFYLDPNRVLGFDPP